ncbi:hypothetical protein TNIN_455311, partial [Trichonephila inaurata madagascariensis]
MDKRAAWNLQKATASEEQQSGKGKENSARTDSKEKKVHPDDYTKVLKCSHPQDKLDSEILISPVGIQLIAPVDIQLLSPADIQMISTVDI